jgi:hypothetical protein
MTTTANIIRPYSASFLTFENANSGMPLAINVISSATRTAVGTSNRTTIITGTFTKLRADTVIRATSTVFGCQYFSGNCGVGLVLDFGTANERWDYGMAYQYDGAWSSTQQTTMVFGQAQWTGVAAGSHTMSFGWNTADGGTNNRPFSILNPNSSDDPRNNQMVSRIVVYEVYP